MKVLKFGGTSVGSVNSILSVKKIVEAIEEPVIVVVSALGGITDKLLATSTMASKGDLAYEKELSEIIARHLDVIEGVIEDKEVRMDVQKKVMALLDELSNIFKGVYLINDLSIYLVVSKPLTLKYSSVTMMKWMFLFSTLITLPFAIESIWNTPAFHKEVFDGQELGAIFFVLFGATFVPYLLIPLALKRIRPTTVSMYNYIQPIVASFIAVCIGQDSFSVTKLVSAALVFSGVYLVTQSKSRADLEQQNSQSFGKNACNMKNNA